MNYWSLQIYMYIYIVKFIQKVELKNIMLDVRRLRSDIYAFDLYKYSKIDTCKHDKELDSNITTHRYKKQIQGE